MRACILFLASSALFVPLQSFGAGTITGTVDWVITRASDGLVYVNIVGTPTGRPTCAQGTTYWMIANENSETGKKQYAMLVAAKLAGSTIIITGSGLCTRWVDGEDIDSIRLAH
ncbi:MAG TPA: hypothetical protein VJQ82_06570 [Terriglobales bacterium]|nr:hypothetical protein [Terriglobales bacterium]